MISDMCVRNIYDLKNTILDMYVCNTYNLKNMVRWWGWMATDECQWTKVDGQMSMMEIDGLCIMILKKEALKSNLFSLKKARIFIQSVSRPMTFSKQIWTFNKIKCPQNVFISMRIELILKTDDVYCIHQFLIRESSL